MSNVHSHPRLPLASRGFTLVELLVVIGIIALLVSILLPSLNKARQSAVSVKCLSNLRQIGIAFRMYANDHHDWFPAYMGRTLDAPFTQHRSSNTWPDMLMDRKYLPDVRLAKTLDDPARPFVNESIVPTSNVFSCPGLTPELPTSGWGGTVYAGGVATTLWSYGIRRSDQDFNRRNGQREQWYTLDGGAPANGTFGGYASKFSKVAQDVPLMADTVWVTSFAPFAQVHFFETRPPASSGLPGPFSGSGTHVHRRHNATANVLFPDFSAKPMGRRELLALRSRFGAGIYSHPVSDRGPGR